MSIERKSPEPPEPAALTAQWVCTAYFDTVTAWVRRLGVPEQEAADAVQDVFTAVLRGFHTFDRSREVRPWLYRVTQRRVHLFLRRHAAAPIPTEEARLETIDTTTLNPEEAMEEETYRTFLLEATAALEDRLRDVFQAHLSGLSHPEIAEALKIPLGTAKSRYATARKQIEAAWVRHRRGQQRGGAILLPLSFDTLLRRERAWTPTLSDAERRRVLARFNLEELLGSLKNPAPRASKITRALRLLRLPMGALIGLLITVLDPTAIAEPSASPPPPASLAIDTVGADPTPLEPSVPELLQRDAARPVVAAGTLTLRSPEGAPAARRAPRSFAREWVQEAARQAEHGRASPLPADLAPAGELESARAVLRGLERGKPRSVAPATGRFSDPSDTSPL